MFDIERVSEDGLTKKFWRFDTVNRPSGLLGGTVGLRLTCYGEGERRTKRHKFRCEVWDSMDERRYHSKLPRPQAIPPDVLRDALNHLPIIIYLGWVRDENVIYVADSIPEAIDSLSDASQ